MSTSRDFAASSASAPTASDPAASSTVPRPAAFGATALTAPFDAMWKAIGAVTLTPPAVAELQRTYLEQSAELWNRTLQAGPAPAADRRFASNDWTSNPASAFIAQMYLLNARTLMQLADSLEGDPKTRQRVRFAVQQWVDAASPSNYLALNPEAQRKAIDTQGQSLAEGIRHLLDDLQRGHVSQTDETAFEIGRNVATTEGTVVFENELFQLIEYKPLTENVYARPMLFVPPCINKYYILDLQPENSVIRHTVEQGHTTFVMSWRNPDESLRTATWDDYIEKGPIRALRAVQEICSVPQVNTLGFCIGGTILTTALAVLAAKGEHPASSMTLLTTFLDFSDTGVLDLFVDEAMVKRRELALGPQSPGGGNLLKGQELATTFSFLRPNDLVWNYVVGNYLKGETPPPFDLLYWNSDGTNLPGPMYCWYLRNTYLENNLVVPGKVTVCGVPLDLGKVDLPTYVYGSREDHIVPWDGAYRSLPLMKGPTRFVLGASGHIAGVINPPAKGKRSHWIGAEGSSPSDAEAWLATATENRGSWWPDWSAWLADQGGEMIDAPKSPGTAAYPPIEPAPGRYVKQKA